MNKELALSDEFDEELAKVNDISDIGQRNHRIIELANEIGAPMPNDKRKYEPDYIMNCIRQTQTHIRDKINAESMWKHANRMFWITILLAFIALINAVATWVVIL